MKAKAAAVVVLVILTLAPPADLPQCDVPSFRRVNPQLCEPFPFPSFGGGGGSGGSGGGLIGRIIHAITGGLL